MDHQQGASDSVAKAQADEIQSVSCAYKSMKPRERVICQKRPVSPVGGSLSGVANGPIAGPTLNTVRNAADVDTTRRRPIVFSIPERIHPGPGQESVWGYPRPPRLEKACDRLRVFVGGEMIAETDRGYRVLETTHPPVYYFPPMDVRREFLVPADGRSLCEFKGMAQYWSLDINGVRVDRAAWSYLDPTDNFRALKDFLAFYASRVESCWVGDERVIAQAGDFYGGWITSRIVGPFKGPPGTRGW